MSDGIFSFTCSLLPKEFHLMPVASFPSPFSFIILGFWFSNMVRRKCLMWSDGLWGMCLILQFVNLASSDGTKLPALKV